METKQLFEDVLSGKLKGTFVLRNGIKINTSEFKRNTNGCINIYPYRTKDYSYTTYGRAYENSMINYDIVDFIPDTDMEENELTIEIPTGKIVDWDESKKQNKIVLKDKQLTYEDICKKLFKNNAYYINVCGDIELSHTGGITDSNNASTEHQLECILAKNKLANVAMYLNGGWKPNKDSHVFVITYYGYGDVNHAPIVAEYIFGNGENLTPFKTQKDALQAIEILGEETIKLALEPLGI